MLRIDDRLGSYSIGAGEPWIMGVQMKMNAGNAIIDWSQRRLVLSFYEAGRVLFHQIEGVYSSDPSGAYFAFIRDGRFSESLLGRSVQVELAERTFNGRDIIATGSLSVATSSQGVASFGSIIGRVEARFTLYFTASNLIALVEQELLPYGGIPVTPGPVITSPAAINSDGTPQVGDTLTGIDPIGNGPVVARRWITGGATVAITQTYAPTAAGALRYEADLQGPDGTILTSFSTITVAAASPISPTKVGTLPHKYFTVDTGPQTFSVAGGFAGANLVYSVRSADPDAVYTLNASTGAMVVQTDTPSSGDVVIRATNSAGFVEQMFPLFVVAVAEYTVLAREDNGTVTVESIAVPPALSLTRNSDGSVTVEESAS